ncbi:MAG: ATP-dependent zinc metalloprotease FtsH [Anaerostipes sp.]|nr:ATP-dependent zinc metalloprotease FtsH [Anaerostipes sp.]MDD3745806.1 ATP-dependent zinc metalloprotease FtsH [Anaerostipes sp.]
MLMGILIASMFVGFLFNAVVSKWQNGTETELKYGKFLTMVQKGEVKEVTIQNDVITVIPKKSKNPVYKTTYKVYRVADEDLVNRLEKAGFDNFKGKEADPMDTFISVLVSLIPTIIIFGLLLFMMRGKGGMMGVGKSNAKVYVEKKTGVTFADVAGQGEAKESLTEMVDFLHNPDKYLAIGAKLPKGALLVGPPGTGKTLLAKAVAGEAKVPFFSLSGSDFVEMFVGVGASRVRDLFKQAQSMAPCIIFIDEIDAIGKSRDNAIGGGGNDEREQTLNQLLSEMDGFDTSKGLVILAATNRPEVLDKALLRPGRFDRRVIVERPDLKGRVETLKVHSKNVKMDETVDFDEIALATSGAVGSDLANMINEAALSAVKAGRSLVSQKDLFEAVEVVIAGKEKKDRILGKEEKQIVAYHEVGHALVMALQKESEPVQKITIVPRTMGALGYTMQRPEEEKYLNKKDEMFADLVAFFGGRAAEEIKFDTVTTGASNDIERATAMARAMVTQYGMSEEFGLMGLESVTNRYLDGRPVMNCAESTSAKVDEVVMGMLKEAYAKALNLLRENMDILDEAAQYLIEKETITGKEFMKIFNEKKGIVEGEATEIHPVEE